MFFSAFTVLWLKAACIKHANYKLQFTSYHSPARKFICEFYAQNFGLTSDKIELIKILRVLRCIKLKKIV